ncbi:MAG TPA: HD domain-containing phosphohydrolase [Phycisphaerae bacterium]|nr:HD domain-containing phosphohydrolase [Phycisphaerae bacterium]
MNAVQTTRATEAHTGVLQRLAERWRPVGIFIASLDRDGTVLWQDSQMPRVLSICLSVDSPIPQQIKRLGEAVTPEGVRIHGQMPWIQMHLFPIMKRRKVASWIVAIARTDAVTPVNEELSHFARRATLDAQLLTSLSHKAPLVPSVVFGALVRVAEQMHADLAHGAQAQHEIADVTRELTSVYEEISLLSKISSGMRFSQKPQAFLETVCREVQQIGNFKAIFVAIAKRSEGGEALGFEDNPVVVGDIDVSADDLIKVLHEPIHDALTVGETQVHNDIAADCDWATLRSKVKRFACVPLEREHRPLGILIAIDKQDATELNAIDLTLLNNVGNQSSIFLENAALYSDMQDLFMGVLHALTRSIDAKDAYTRGHSQRVAELSRELARKIGLPEEQCERIYLSGLLHDVGKIGVPEAVLTKPGKLTDEEFTLIKKHPEIGAQILGNIRQLQDIIPGVLYHHERWDGRGYPHMLAGDKIPLLGRIICVADSFDAMTSTRTYRAARSLEAVLKEIERCAGSQFDPALARVFVTLDFGPYMKSVAEQELAAASVKVPLLENGARP